MESKGSDGHASLSNGYPGGRNGSSVSDLSRELPVIDYDLVPLSTVVQRVAGQCYKDLVNLAETLPDTLDAARKRKIVEYVLNARRQLIKLLVLVRWSKDADSLRKCMNIIGFLGRQNLEFDRAVQNIAAVKSMLAGARQRNYDLVTAVSVLTTGDYTALPASLSDPYKGVQTLSNDDALAILNDMNIAIKWRLACIESVPRAMRSYTIDDGRATFRIDGMWEAAFTYGGDQDDENTRWYLLDLKFLFQVKDARGKYSPTPVGPMKEHIIELCNRELAPSDSVPGAPLERAYYFLQRLALNYKLESLYEQASRLERAWNNQIKVDFRDRRLRIDYWIAGPQAASKAHVAAVQIDVAKGRRAPRYAALDPLAAEEEEMLVEWLSEATSSDIDLTLDYRLDVETVLTRVTKAHSRWSVERLFKQLQTNPPKDVPISLVDRPDDTRRVRAQLFSTNVVFLNVNSRTGKLDIEPADPTSVVNEARLKSAADKIDKDRNVAADILTRLSLGAIQDELESRLSLLGLETTRRLALRSADLSRFGSSSSSRSFLFVKLKHHPLFYMTLVIVHEGVKVALMSTRVEADAVSSWLTIGEIGWIDARTLASSGDDIDVYRAKASEQPPLANPDISIDSLRRMYDYCQVRISYYRIELGLLSRRIHFKTVGFVRTSLKRRRARNEADAAFREPPPYLVLNSNDLLLNAPPPIPRTSSATSLSRDSAMPDLTPVCDPNVAVQCFVSDERIRTIVVVRFNDLDLVRFDPARLPRHVRIAFVAERDAPADEKGTLAKSKKGVVTLVIDKEDVDEAVPCFLSAFAVFAKAIVEARYERYNAQMKRIKE